MSTADYINSDRPVLGAKARRERGFALLLTIFGLLLLTAVAMAMMFSSDAETSIAVNYRDAQSASYSAMSALAEARDRLHPLNGDLALAGFVPTNTPDSGAKGTVLYIINPNTAYKETVATIAPWKATINGKPNPYFDSELCQENMTGAIGAANGAPGVSCPAVNLAGNCTQVGGAAGGWCTYYDNSANATNWDLKDAKGNAIPLDYKWVRVTLKEDWNTPVFVPNSASAAGKQVCWDGSYQSQIPGTYSTKCQPIPGNQVIGLNITAAGSNFTTAPTVTIAGGGGNGATATATIGPAPADGIASVVLTSPGSGYTSPPLVTIASGPATFKAIVGTSAVTGVTINPAGSSYCYATTVTPAVNFTTNPISNTLAPATASVTMNTTAGCIATVTPAGSCKNTTAGKSYSIKSGGPAGGGSGFSGSVTFLGNNKTNTITITGAGTGYSSGSSSVTITNDAGANCSISPSFTTGYQVKSIAVSSGGSYMSQPTAVLGGSPPSSPSVPVLPALTVQPSPWPANASAVTAVNVTGAGSGYTPGVHYALTFTGGGGTGAAGYAVGGGTFILSGLTLTNGGSGYTSAPAVTINGGGGTGATATATIGSGGLNTSMGQIYMLTSMAVTRSGSKSMAQMEAAARPPFYFNLGGALTLAGPLPLPPPNPPNFDAAHANNFDINGGDKNSCAQAVAAQKPAIGTYNSNSQQAVIDGLPGGRLTNYTGVGGSPGPPPVPSVEVSYTAIGGADATPSALDGFISDLASKATYSVNGNATTLPSTTTSSVTYINGNLTLSGNPNGSGILIVTGTLTLQGDFTWNGLVLVVGQGAVVNNGGGNGVINGAIYVAKTCCDVNGNELATLGTPNFAWTGGGGNTVNYDHCLADNLLNKYQGQPSGLPLQVLSTRMLQF